LPDSFRTWKYGGVYGVSEGFESVKKRGRGRIEKLVAYAPDAPAAGSGCLLPTAISDDFL
jgi:hypothetical protein